MRIPSQNNKVEKSYLFFSRREFIAIGKKRTGIWKSRKKMPVGEFCFINIPLLRKKYF